MFQQQWSNQKVIVIARQVPDNDNDEQHASATRNNHTINHTSRNEGWNVQTQVHSSNQGNGGTQYNEINENSNWVPRSGQKKQVHPTSTTKVPPTLAFRYSNELPVETGVDIEEGREPPIEQEAAVSKQWYRKRWVLGSIMTVLLLVVFGIVVSYQGRNNKGSLRYHSLVDHAMLLFVKRTLVRPVCLSLYQNLKSSTGCS